MNTRFLAGVTALIALTIPAFGAAFVPGHLYTPIDGGYVVEWDSDLNEVRRFRTPGVLVSTGAEFNARGNLVMKVTQGGAGRIIEVDADGAIVNQYALGMNIGRGEYLDYDRTRDMYVCANSTRLLFLDSNLSLIGQTEPLFSRASGVAIAADGTIYAGDQNRNVIREFDIDTLAFIRQRPINTFTTAGIDIDADDNLYVSSYSDGRLLTFNTDTGANSSWIGPLGYGAVSDVLTLPGGDVITCSFHAQLRRYSPNGVLIDAQLNEISFGDSVAYFVPSTGTGCSLAIGLSGTMTRRRRNALRRR